MLKHPSSYCSELERVENYELALKDNFKGWDCHHRLETHTSDGERRLVDISCKELKALGMYYNRPPEELIFLTVFDHVSLHHRGKPGTWIGRHHSEETKKKISEARKGKKLSEETRNKISEANKGHPGYFIGKHHSKEWIMNKSDSMKGENNPFYGNHHSEETKKKISEAQKGNTATKGMHWFNNGKVNKMCFECPDGFVPGMLR